MAAGEGTLAKNLCRAGSKGPLRGHQSYSNTVEGEGAAEQAAATDWALLGQPLRRPVRPQLRRPTAEGGREGPPVLPTSLAGWLTPAAESSPLCGWTSLRAGGLS